MIRLTRLNNRALVVNADLIKFIELAPDTVITLLTGEKLVVRETEEEVLARIHAFHLDSGRRIAPETIGEIGSPRTEANLERRDSGQGPLLPESIVTKLPEGEHS
jgi:flagellar protein FlbD